MGHSSKRQGPDRRLGKFDCGRHPVVPTVARKCNNGNWTIASVQGIAFNLIVRAPAAGHFGHGIDALRKV